jgi:signal transduction histidine kinase
LPVRCVTNVERLIDDVVLRAEVPATVRVERQVSRPLPPLLLDDHHLLQILWNLARNAVQAMQEDGGVLTFVVDYVDGRLRIEVRDTGSGVLPSEAERVFEPMYTTKANGIGLGLSVSRTFARANGGDLFVIAGDGGARFVLELPAETAGSQASALPAGEDGALTGPSSGTNGHGSLDKGGAKPGAPRAAPLPAIARR